MTAEPALARASIYAAQPFVQVDGRRHRLLDELLLGLEVVEQGGGLSSLEMRFVNVAAPEGENVDFAFEHSEPELLTLGKPVVVGTGDENDPQEVFRGTITAVEFVAAAGRPPELTVLAEDGLQKARMARRTRLHTDTTVADLVETVAAELGLRAVVDGLQETLETELQLNESDLSFLRRILGRYDADLQVSGEELQASPRGEVRRGELTLELDSQLIAARVSADLAHQATAVTFSGWDPAQGERVEAENGSGADLGPGQGRTGAQVLNESLGERPEHLGNGAAHDEREAQALVNARYAQRARGFVRVDAVAEGNPALRVGCHVTLQGVGPRFDNTYYVTATRHRYDRVEGYRTEFQAESAYWGG